MRNGPIPAQIQHLFWEPGSLRTFRSIRSECLGFPEKGASLLNRKLGVLKRLLDDAYLLVILVLPSQSIEVANDQLSCPTTASEQVARFCH